MSKPLDRLALLETFARISDRGSISAAARDLGMSQGSASRQLKDLEDRLGVQLIRRTTHSLALTEAGSDVLSDARDILTRWDGLEERHADAGEALRGALKVVAPVALGQSHLADIALAFQQEHPHVSLTWVLQDEPIRFAEMGCDCWIKVGSIPDETLIVRPLGRVERLLAAAPALVSTTADLSVTDAEGLPFVSLTPFEGERIELMDKAGNRRRFTPHVRLATNNVMSVKRAVVRGAGAAVLPRWFIADELDQEQLTDVLPMLRAPTLDIHVGYLPVRRQPRRLTAFLEALQTGVRQIAGIVA